MRTDLGYYRHKKTGFTYTLLHKGKLEVDETEVAIYRSDATTDIWVRPWSEFEDKFEFIR